MKEKNKKVLKNVMVGVGTVGVGVGIGILIGKNCSKTPEITELVRENKELKVENERLDKENHKLYKRIESLIYHLGQVVSSRNKSYQI